MFCFSKNIKLKNIISVYILFSTLTLLFSKIVNAQIERVKPKKIILLIGQSNMSGRAPMVKGDMEVVENAFLFDSLNQWIPLKSPLNIHSSIRKNARMQRFNLGYSFAEEITRSKTIIPLGMVVNARGGTKISQWTPDTHYYKEAVRRCKLAMGEDGLVVATFWLQGEGNLNDDDENFKAYFQKLKSIIYSLREDLNNKKMIFLAAELNKNKSENEIFKKMLAQLDNKVENAGSVKSFGTSTYDGTHYDNKSLRVLGVRFAEKLKNLLKKTNL